VVERPLLLYNRTMGKFEKVVLTEKQKKSIYIISIIIFILLMIFLTFVVGKPLVTYAKEPEKFKEWLNSFGVFSKIIFILITSLQVIIAFIPGEAFEIAAGYCFGTWEGLLLSLLGITLGSFAIYKAVEKFGESLISIFFKDKEIKQISFLKDPTKAKSLAFILNVIPGIPKDILCYFAPLTCINLPSWLLITFVGRIPSVVSSTIAGDCLSKKEYASTTIVVIITAIISITGIIIYNLILKKENKTN